MRFNVAMNVLSHPTTHPIHDPIHEQINKYCCSKFTSLLSFDFGLYFEALVLIRHMIANSGHKSGAISNVSGNTVLNTTSSNQRVDPKSRYKELLSEWQFSPSVSTLLLLKCAPRNQ